MWPGAFAAGAWEAPAGGRLLAAPTEGLRSAGALWHRGQADARCALSTRGRRPGAFAAGAWEALAGGRLLAAPTVFALGGGLRRIGCAARTGMKPAPTGTTEVRRGPGGLTLSLRRDMRRLLRGAEITPA